MQKQLPFLRKIIKKTLDKIFKSVMMYTESKGGQLLSSQNEERHNVKQKTMQKKRKGETNHETWTQIF